jgi:hypothetical protein
LYAWDLFDLAQVKEPDMAYNAYIVDRTMDRFAQLKQELTDASFPFGEESGSKNISVAVPVERVQEFAALCQKHFNAPFNYVDIQYPSERKTVLVFRAKTFIITSREENERVRQWAVGSGLPPEQSDWGTSF